IDTWRGNDVIGAVERVLCLLTGDIWQIELVNRIGRCVGKPQNSLPLPDETKSVIAYSDGLDSRAVAEMIDTESPGSLLRVRVGSKASAGERRSGLPVPFTGIPYQINMRGRKPVES